MRDLLEDFLEAKKTKSKPPTVKKKELNRTEVIGVNDLSDLNYKLLDVEIGKMMRERRNSNKIAIQAND